MAIRHRRRCQRDHVWIAWPFPGGTPALRRRRLRPPGLRPFDRKRRQQPSRILIGFNTGTYESIDLCSWIAGNPVDVLATNFNKPESLICTFPRKDVFIAPSE